MLQGVPPRICRTKVMIGESRPRQHKVVVVYTLNYPVLMEGAVIVTLGECFFSAATTKREEGQHNREAALWQRSV